MFEFAARILLAGGAVFFAGGSGWVSFPLALGAGVVIGALAVAAHALHARGFYDGAGAGLHAGLEGLAVALMLVDAGRAESLGFLVLLPYAWVAGRRKAPWAAGAFAGAFALVGAYAILKGSEPTVPLLLQAGGALGLGLLLALRAEEVPLAEAAPTEDLELRGRFRALREAYAVLERRTADDAHAATLARATTPDAMAQSLRDATGASGAALFAPVDDGWEAVGRAGAVPVELEETFRSGRALQEKGAVMLFAAGRPVGAAWLPEGSRDGLAGVADTLSSRLSDRLEAETERRRRRAAELRVTLIEGGDSPDEVARALGALVGADSVEFGMVGPFGATALGRFGPPCALPEALRHETGPGLDGWAAAGSPLVWVADARSDARLDGTDSLRARTAALALVPLGGGRAYAWAAWHVPGAGRPSALATMRAAEPVVVRWMDGVREELGSAGVRSLAAP